MAKTNHLKKTWKVPKLNCRLREFTKDPRLTYLKLTPQKRWLYLDYLQTTKNLPRNHIEQNIKDHHYNVWQIFKQLDLKNNQYIDSGQHKHVFVNNDSVIKIYNNNKLLNRERKVYTWLHNNNFDDLTLPTTFFDNYSKSPLVTPLQDNNFDQSLCDNWRYAPMFFNEFGLRIDMKWYNLCIWNNQLRLLDIGEFVEKSAVTTDILSLLQIARNLK